MRRLTTFIAALAGSAIMSAGLAHAEAPSPEAVLKTHADIALAGYEDSLSTAKTMKAQIDAFLAKPTDATLSDAKAAWIAARVPYQQTEVFRFGNAIVDDWEGKVNAWPLDEGLIDYVATDYGTTSEENPLYIANIISNPKIKISGRDIDASQITKELLSETLHEAGGVEANVATGYHAIEFLLWGQDLNGTDKGAGARPASDYDTANCTGGNCERRAQYLSAATDLLIDDLEWIVAQWKDDGEARKKLMTGSAADGLVAIFTGMGSLSYGELAGERMKLGLLLNDPEEEHDCFSDNTHNSHYFNAAGIRNVYLGQYKRIDGSMVSGPSVSDLVKAKAPEIDTRVLTALDATMARFEALKSRAETTEAYDQMIAEANDEGNAVVDEAIKALIAQTREFERAIAALDLSAIQFEGSDSLDNPEEVAQ